MMPVVSLFDPARRRCALALVARLLVLPGSVAAAQTADTVAGTTRSATKPATVLDASVITASRTALSVRDVPANISVLNARDIRIAAAKSISDFLRVIPGYAPRDFQSTLVAHPSRQAPSLRGIGGTSASRTLVLLDGIPMNEPFAGWVHWSRIPLSLVRSVEVVRGGAAAVWGDRALGGVIHLLTDDPRSTEFSLSASGGSFNTARTTATASARNGRLGLLFSGDYLRTDGYKNVRPDLRGSIDRNINSRDVVVYGKASLDLSPLTTAYLSASYMDDFRNNGTALKWDGTRLADVRAGFRGIGTRSVVSGSFFANHTSFDNYSSSESLDRQTETPNLHQWDVPSNASGAQLQWSRQVAGAHRFTLGTDATLVSGGVTEDLNYVQNAFTRRRHVGGEQVLAGAYAEDAIALGDRWGALASVRLDTWRNRDGVRRERDLRTSALVVDTAFAPATASRPSFSIGVRNQATTSLLLRGSTYQSFRVPTLNELYKPFRESGNVITEANPTLGPERLLGVDVGADYTVGSALLARVTGFWSRVRGSIFEVTVDTAGRTARTIAPCGAVPAGGTCRQRRSIDVFRTSGVETELEWRPVTDWLVRGGYTWNPTEVVKAVKQPLLVGKAGKGAARQSVSGQLSYDNPRLGDATVSVRYVGERWDDDANTLYLDPFTVTDLRLGRLLTSRARLFASVENLFNVEYPATRAASGLVRIGGPRFVEAGVRYQW
jgi:outer membrane receptor protein involved in Fe transport